MEDTSLNQLVPQQISERGESLLAFIASEKLSALAKRSALQQDAGWIVRGDEVLPWRFSGYVRRGDQLLVTGPYLRGELLSAALQRPGEALAAVARVAAAVTRLAQNRSLAPLQLNGIYLLADGGVLVLPPAVVRQLTETISPAASLAAAARINHPDLTGEQRLCVMLAILSYRAVTREYPFPAPREDELRDQMRRLDVVPAHLLAPGSNQELSSLITRTLRPQRNEQRPPLREWPATLTRAIAEATVAPVAAGEVQRLQAEAAALRHRNEQAFRRHVFLQRNLRTMVVAGVIVVALGGMLGSIIANQFKPRSTRGYSPRQVVETFYASMGELDHTTMEDTVVGDAGKGVINEVVNLFVVSRVAQGYEGRSHIVNAAEWVAEGEPQLPPGRSLYGPTKLTISAERGLPQPVFRVSYLMWRPGGADGEDPPGTPQQGIPMSERVFLRQDKGDWVIFQFEPVQPLPGE